MDGTYNPLGVPFETIKSRYGAIRMLMRAGLTNKQAERELSKFYRRDSGLAAVCSFSYSNAHLCINIYDEPGFQVFGIIFFKLYSIAMCKKPYL